MWLGKTLRDVSLESGSASCSCRADIRDYTNERITRRRRPDPKRRQDFKAVSNITLEINGLTKRRRRVREKAKKKATREKSNKLFPEEENKGGETWVSYM